MEFLASIRKENDFYHFLSFTYSAFNNCAECGLIKSILCLKITNRVEIIVIKEMAQSSSNSAFKFTLNEHFTVLKFNIELTCLNLPA